MAPAAAIQATQASGIDLPLEAQVWEDEAGACRFSCNDPARLADRHGIAEATRPVTANMATLLGAIGKAMTSDGA